MVLVLPASWHAFRPRQQNREYPLIMHRSLKNIIRPWLFRGDGVNRVWGGLCEDRGWLAGTYIPSALLNMAYKSA